MTTIQHAGLRAAGPGDRAEVLRLWSLLFEDEESGASQPWKTHAAAWFARAIDDPGNARLPVIEVDGAIVATAIGTLELGVPNPQSVKGRAVRLANLITLPEHRGRGHGRALVLDVIDWAGSIGADRVDLSATPDGERLYAGIGFTRTSAPRMKLVL